MSGEQAVEGRCTGRVQGVMFRASMQEAARELGLRGWVRNEADGSVTFAAAGDGAAVRALVDWAGQGPPAAKVEAVDTNIVDPGAVTGTDFEVR